jgi:hypothetical protein
MYVAQAILDLVVLLPHAWLEVFSFGFLFCFLVLFAHARQVRYH